MHSDISMRIGASFHFGFRSCVSMRSVRVPVISISVGETFGTAMTESLTRAVDTGGLGVHGPR